MRAERGLQAVGWATLPRAGVFALVHCFPISHGLEQYRAHSRHSINACLGKGEQRHPTFQQQQQTEDSKAGVGGAGDGVGILKGTRPPGLG